MSVIRRAFVMIKSALINKVPRVKYASWSFSRESLGVRLETNVKESHFRLIIEESDVPASCTLAPYAMRSTNENIYAQTTQRAVARSVPVLAYLTL